MCAKGGGTVRVYIYSSETPFTKLVFKIRTCIKRENNQKTIIFRRDEIKRMCKLNLYYIKLSLKGTQRSPVLLKQVGTAHSRQLKI